MSHLRQFHCFVRRPAVTLILIVTTFLTVFAGSAGAVVMTDLYLTTVPISDATPAGRDEAFRAALAEVIVRVTGRRDAPDDETLEPLLQSARRLAVQFRNTRDGELWVEFDGRALERQLLALEQPVWGRERPTTLVWLAVEVRPGHRRIANAAEPLRLDAPDAGATFMIPAVPVDEEQSLQERVGELAILRGLPLVWPLVDTEDLGRLSFAEIWAPFDEEVLAASMRYNVDSVLVGAFRHRSGQGPRVRWTLYFGGQRRQVTGALNDGIDMAADLYADRFAVRDTGDLDNSITMTVAGVDSLENYARVYRYLEQLTMVVSLEVDQLSSDVVSFRLALRGTPDTLRNAIALGQVLEPEVLDEFPGQPAVGDAMPGLRYRLNL